MTVIAEVDPKSVNPTINFNPTAYDGNMETSRLVEQIESLRGAVRYLRSEIALLKSQDLMGELDALPRYTYNSSSPFTSTATDGPKDAVDDDGRAGKDDAQVQDRFYAASLKSLLHEARILSATPKVVDLSFALQASVGGEKGRGRKWMPASRAPEMQWMVEKERTRELSRKLEKLTSVSHSWKGRSLIQAGV
jgi:dynactin 1